MWYEFRCDGCGTINSVQMSMAEAPRIGDRYSCRCTACEGSEMTRVVSAVGANREYQDARNKYPYVSRQFGPLEGIRRREGAGQVIESQAHEREVMAANGLKRT